MLFGKRDRQPTVPEYVFVPKIVDHKIELKAFLVNQLGSSTYRECAQATRIL